MKYRNRKIEPARLVSSTAAAACFAVAGLGMAGCDLQSPVSLAVTPLTGGTASGGGLGSYALNKINDLTSDQYVLALDGKSVMAKTLTYKFTGTCARGTSAVQLTVDSVVQSTTYACPSVGDLSITYTFASSAIHTVVFTPLDSSGAATTATPVTQQVFPKTSNSQEVSGLTTIPSSPTADPSLIVVAGSVVINGSFNTGQYVANVVETQYGLGTMTVSNGAFNYSLTITLGQSISLKFQTVDTLGNVSGGYSATLSTSNAPPTIFQLTGASLPAGTATTGLHSTAVNYLTAFSIAPMMGLTVSGSDKLYLGVPSNAVQGP